MSSFKFVNTLGNKNIQKYIVRAFIGSITRSGKKSKAMRFFNLFLFDIVTRFECNPVDFLESIIETVRPKVFLTSKKISGSTVRIPTPINISRSYSIAIKWFLASSLKKKGSPVNQLIFFELLDIYTNPMNQTLRKRDEYHKLAKLNRPFLRYIKVL